MSESAAALARTIAAGAGPDARPREDQLRAVEELVEHRSRVLVVQATGWGKSAVYWAATAALRELGIGPTLVVSPLLALMRDQIAAASRAGLRAATINSTNVDEWSEVLRRPALREARRAAHFPGAARQSRLRRPAAGPARRVRPAGDRRGALRLRLGLRLPARLPAAHPDPAATGAGHARAGHHRHGQRAGDRWTWRPSSERTP